MDCNLTFGNHYTPNNLLPVSACQFPRFHVQYPRTLTWSWYFHWRCRWKGSDRQTIGVPYLWMGHWVWAIGGGVSAMMFITVIQWSSFVYVQCVHYVRNLFPRVPAFTAAKYLVTNHDFLAFVRDGGYQKQCHWSDEGTYVCMYVCIH